MTLSWISTIYPNRLGSHIMDYSCHISPMIHHFPAISSWGDADCGGDISKVGDWMTAGWPDSWKVTFSNKTGQTHGEIRFRWFQMISWYKNMWSRPHRTELMMFIIIWYNCIFIIFKIFKSTFGLTTPSDSRWKINWWMCKRFLPPSEHLLRYWPPDGWFHGDTWNMALAHYGSVCPSIPGFGVAVPLSLTFVLFRNPRSLGPFSRVRIFGFQNKAPKCGKKKCPGYDGDCALDFQAWLTSWFFRGVPYSTIWSSGTFTSNN
jgi:hypothetical protein